MCFYIFVVIKRFFEILFVLICGYVIIIVLEKRKKRRKRLSSSLCSDVNGNFFSFLEIDFLGKLGIIFRVRYLVK